MRALLLEFPAPISEAPLHPADLPPPQPGPGQVLIEVSHCGVSEVDLQTVEGELALARLPLIPGHQVVGRVVDQGPGGFRFAPGDRVGLSRLFYACGACRFCRGARENLCEEAQFTGLHRDGGFAELVVAYEDFVYRLPEGLPDSDAAPLLGAGLAAYRALKVSGIQSQGLLGLFGFDAPGQVALQIARSWDCKVFVFTGNPRQQAWARELGATWVGETQDTPPGRLDGAILFAPGGQEVPEALRLLHRGGTLALAGAYKTPTPPLDYEKDLYYERTLRSVTAATRQDGRELLELATRVAIAPAVELFPLRDANAVLKLLKSGQIKGAGVLAMV